MDIDHLADGWPTNSIIEKLSNLSPTFGAEFFIRRGRHLLRKQGIDKLRIDFVVALARRKPM